MTTGSKSNVAFRYPTRPGRPSVTCMPSIGDFVVITLDPMRTVAHLNAQAKRDAALLPVRSYIALVTDVVGCKIIFTFILAHAMRLRVKVFLS